MRFEWDEVKNRRNLGNIKSALRPRGWYLLIHLRSAFKTVLWRARNDGRPWA